MKKTRFADDSDTVLQVRKAGQSEWTDLKVPPAPAKKKTWKEQLKQAAKEKDANP